MSTSRIFPSLSRNVASSSRQTLQRSLATPKPALVSPAYTAFRSQSTLRTSRPFLTASLPRNLQHRTFSAAATLHNDRSRIESFLPETTPSTNQLEDDPASIPVTGERTPIGQIEQRLAITFTCTVDECGHRSSHEFSKRSYTKGIVIVQCPGCKNRHLIADNLSWFTETEDEPRTIEQMIEARGGKVRRGTVGVDGETGETIEILS
ncbi:related to ZIM17 - Zinc finger Motif protein, mitochondrial [Ustilago trichophora]|uniref:Related to ZIM17 - Zinc finger Motif protein, mitochondrial n=1 Tax=Ustilago trichophora TaxID=86804 RepID=A0A5C3DNF4_9BASI|nr:related to ZIM17 - Zinc finger Motif protein, mitochondrial [Ustilago trichophora]